MDPLTIFTIAAASYTTIDLIIKHVNVLRKSLEDHRSLRASVQNLQAFVVQGSQSMLNQRLDVAKVIMQTSNDETVKANLDDTFQKIQITINEAAAVLKEIDNPTGRGYLDKREKKKAKVEEIKVVLKTLKQAEEKFTSIVQLAHIKKTLPSMVLLSERQFKVIQTVQTSLPSNITLVEGHLSPNESRPISRRGLFLLEAREGPESDIRDFAEVLTEHDTTPFSHGTGVLGCVGYRPHSGATTNPRYQLVFAFPAESKYEGTLQQHIQTTLDSPPSLDLRIDLCYRLANAILQVHKMKLVHKNVNTANVIVTRPNIAASAVTVPPSNASTVFLIDWRLTKIIGSATSGATETTWWRRLYQHPDRHLQPSLTEYTMDHDIYSLGVCMIEVLLWKSLLEGHESGPPGPLGQIGSSLFDSPIPETPKPSAILKSMMMLEEHDGETDADELIDMSQLEGSEMQDILIKLARIRLPAAVGGKLTDLVISCLKCKEGSFGPISFSGPSRLETCLNFVTTVKSDLWEVKLAVT